jgi:hypothetical protein
MMQLQQGGGGAEVVIHATSRRSSYNPRCCNPQSWELRRSAAGAAKACRSCKGWPLVLQKPGDNATTPHHLSCKDRPQVLQDTN